MSALEPLSNLIGIKISNLSETEVLYIEGGLLIAICYEIKEMFRNRYKDYFRLMKYNIEMENAMLDDNYVRFIINDIISTNEYTLAGIAYYTQTPEDVVYDLASGSNTRPSAIFLQKIIELHRNVKRDLYDEIFKKIISDYL